MKPRSIAYGRGGSMVGRVGLWMEVGHLSGTRNNSGRRSGRRRLIAVVGAAWLAALSGGAVGAAALRDDRTLVMDAGAAADARGAAAKRLLELPEPEARAALTGLLDDPGAVAAGDGGESAAMIVLRQVAAMSSAPGWLVEPIGRLGAAGSGAQRGLAMDALGSVRTQSAARVLVGVTMAGGAESERAMGALARMTGRVDLGSDARAWERWWREVEFVPEVEWTRRLSVDLAARADALARERDAATGRVLDAARARYQGSTTIEARSALLEGFILDELPAVRRLGLELALQELANARTPGPGVADAAVKVLSDPSAELRRLAADALIVLASPETAARIHQALVFEVDPRVAAPLLRSAARWPESGSAATVLRWLEAGEPAASAALDAASAMLDAGMLGEGAERSRVLAAVRLMDIEKAPASGLRLLAALGDESDRERVIGLLSRGDAAVRQRAAEALASEGGEGLDALLAAAGADSGLFMPAARAIARHRATPDGVFALARLPAPSPDERRQQLLLVAGRLSAGELLAVARGTEDAELRELLLARLTSEPLRAWTAGGGIGHEDVGKNPHGHEGAEESARPEVIAGLFLLAQTRLDLGQPGLALRALDGLEVVRESVDVTLLDSMRTLSLLLLGRVSDASKLNGSPEAWLLGLEESVDEMHAMAIVREIERRWGADALGPEQSARLGAARASAGAFVGPTADVPRAQ